MMAQQTRNSGGKTELLDTRLTQRNGQSDENIESGGLKGNTEGTQRGGDGSEYFAQRAAGRESLALPTSVNN